MAQGLELTVQRLDPRHLDQIMALEQASFPGHPWQREIFLALMNHPQAITLGAFAADGDRLLGSLCLMIDGKMAQVQNLAVHPGQRGRGIGRFLLGQGLAEARAQGCRLAALEVRPSNQRARRLYAALGFQEVCRKAAYYQQPLEDALVLACRLAETPGPDREMG